MVGLLDLFESAGVDVESGVLDRDTDLFDRGRAVLETLRRLADDRTVVLAIDDLQWLDPISRRSLRYALRRLEDLPVLLLATERTGAGDGDAMTLVPPERTEVITLGALPIEAIRQVLTPVTSAISRPALALVHDPVRRGTRCMPSSSPGRPTSIGTGWRSPRDRRWTLRCRRASPARRLRSAWSCRRRPPSARRRRRRWMWPAVSTRATSWPAPSTGACSRSTTRCSCGAPTRCWRRSPSVTWSRPTAAPSMRTSPTWSAIRMIRLATSLWRRSTGTRLELRRSRTAADRAGRRGASGLAAEFAAHSLRLSPLDDWPALARRAVAEILHRASAGETGRAISMLDAILAGLPPGPDRFAALSLRVVLDAGSAEEVLAQAEEEGRADELVRGRTLDLVAYTTYLHDGQLDRGRQLETEALAIARRHHDIELEMLASATLSTITLLSGDPQPELMDQALELGRQVQNPRLGRWPAVERGRQCLWAGHLDEARELFAGLEAMTARSGIEFQRPFRAFDMAFVELAAGRLAVAAQRSGDGLESALDAGNAPIATWLRYPDGLVHAHLGSDDERVRRNVDAMRAWGLEHGERTRVLMAHHVAGVLALTHADGTSALTELLEGVALGRRLGFAHPGVVPILPDAIEAAVATGAVDLAADLATELESQAAALGLPWVDAAALRGRSLAAMAAGDKLAAGSLAAAVAAFDRLGYRLDAARASLWHGRALLRTGRRAPASDALADARDRLEALEARPWVAQAAADLERVAPGRASGALTEDEARIAALVSAGRRNREIAAELYVSVATVEAHLTRIYRKLDVRSRTELSRRLLESSTPAQAPSGTVGT